MKPWQKAGPVLKSKAWKALDKDQDKTLDGVAYAILRDVGVFIKGRELLKMEKCMGGISRLQEDR